MEHRTIHPAPHRNAQLATDSTLIEKALEYQLTGMIMASLLRRGHRYEVLHSVCDRDGYDVVIEARGVIRHVQFKAIVEGGRRSDFTLHIGLQARPSACAICICWDPATYQPTRFRFLGGAPGVPIPDLGNRLARHSRGNRHGIKGSRPDHRVIAARQFVPVDDVEDLVDHLFGAEQRNDRQLLLKHLDASPACDPGSWLEEVRRGNFSAIPDELDWNKSSELAHLIDGYALARDMCVDPDSFLQSQTEAAALTGSWPGNAAGLWATLFLEHRRKRFAGEDDGNGELLNRLIHQLAKALNQ